MSIIFPKVDAEKNSAFDAFGRVRVGNPLTLFDSKQIYDNQPLFWDESEESGSGGSFTHSTDRASTELASTASTATTLTRQTFMWFNYQPGKSQLIKITGILDKESTSGTGATARLGVFNDDNGLFFEIDAGVVKVVRRSSASGSPVDSPVVQSSWEWDKLDGSGPSGVIADWSKTQIFVIDFEWLATGSVRFGVVIGGKIIYCHQLKHANVLDVVYMSTPNLPLRAQLITTSSAVATKMEIICATVISEGGVAELGVLHNESTNDAQVACASAGTHYAIIGIRLKSTHLGARIDLDSLHGTLQSASDDIEWVLWHDATVVGGVPSWTSKTNSAVEYFLGTGTLTVSAGTRVANGYLSTGSGNQADSAIGAERLSNALRLGSDIAGNSQRLVLSAQPISGTSNADVEASITWREHP